MPLRASHIVLIYFVIGAVMFGGGAVSYDDSGVTQFFVTKDPDGVSPADEPEQKLDGVSGVITNLVGAFGGPAILVWNLFVGLLTYIHWPLVVLIENAAPPRVTVLLGGTFQVAFYMAAIRLVKSSA
jgi:hypothetical protein